MPSGLRGPLLLAAAGLALAACNHAPTYQQPELPIADRFDVSDTPGSQHAQEIAWPNFFGDPQLKFLIATALANNRDLAASVARIEQARAQYRIQDAARLPQVNATAGAARTQAPLSLLEPELPATNATFIFNQYNVQAAMASYELDFWGRVANLGEAARRRYLATVEADRAFRLSLIASVAAAYYAIRAGEEGVALATQTVTERQYAQEIAGLRLDAGLTSTVDYDQAAILVTQAQAQLAELLRTTEQRRAQLTVLVGGPVRGPLPAPRPIGDPGQFVEIAAGLPSDLLANRPDILQAEQQLRAANADIGVARAAFFPRIALTGNFGYASPELGDLFRSGNQAWTLAGVVSLPLFDGGLLQAQLGFAQARRDELVAVYQRSVQTAFSEVSEALVGRRRYQEQIVAQEAQVAAQRRLAEVAELRYENGIAIYLEVADARRNLFAAEQQLIQLRATALQNGVALYVALGGGLEAPSPDRR
jgi:multidrug efflux system outer membrane protein